MAPGLLGPPELKSTIDDTTITTVDNQILNKSQPSITSQQQTKTLSFLTTGNPCLDFFHVLPDTPHQELIQRLQFSYQSDPLKTLKLVANLRGVRGTGKNDKEGFYASVLWLHQNHPKTLANNVGLFARFGSLKDLLEILFRIIEGLYVRKRMKDAWEVEKPTFFTKRWAKKVTLSELEEKKRKAQRAEKKAQKAKKALDRYTHDPEYKFLYDCICDVFAHLLREDVKLLHSGVEHDLGKISLAAKWCPSLDSSFDESLLICESIAKKIFTKEEYVEYKDIEEAHYAYRVRTRLRKEVLVPLRKTLELPEVYMCAKRWRDIPYEKVASLAMHLSKKVFQKRDLNGFEEFIEQVRDGESTIAAGALLPHEIIGGISERDSKLDDVLELQWNRMVDDLSKQGKLINCTAVSDDVDSDKSVSLMLLVSELTGHPWKNKVITAGEFPELFEIEGEKLDTKVNYLKNTYGGGGIHLQEVIDTILNFAGEKNLGDDEMIRRLFVFTETETRIGDLNPIGAEYNEIQRKFLDKGYKRVPEIVFWNLKSSVAVPVRCDQPGVAVVSGFSKNLLSLFFEELGVLTPEAVMNAAISRPEYHNLVVHD